MGRRCAGEMRRSIPAGTLCPAWGSQVEQFPRALKTVESCPIAASCTHEQYTATADSVLVDVTGPRNRARRRVRARSRVYRGATLGR